MRMYMIVPLNIVYSSKGDLRFERYHFTCDVSVNGDIYLVSNLFFRPIKTPYFWKFEFLFLEES